LHFNCRPDTMSPMLAVISVAGKQYRVTPGDKIYTDKVVATVGQTIFSDVLLTTEGDTTVVGTPTVNGVKATLKVVEQTKDEKIDVRRFSHKTRTRRNRGHRAKLTVFEVVAVGTVKDVKENSVSKEVAEPKVRKTRATK